MKIAVRHRTSPRRSSVVLVITLHLSESIRPLPKRFDESFRIASDASYHRGVTNRRATIADVARVAGVSPSTASVVFSGKTPVSDTTRLRVMDAAASLGYTGPDPRAASLRLGRSGIVAVVVGSSLNFMFVDPVQRLLMDGLAEAVAPLGAGLLLLRRDAELDIENAPTLTTASIDAAVLIGCDGSLRESLPIVLARGIPVVVVEGDAGEGIPRIALDNREAERRAAEHIRDLGHTRVAIVTLWQDAAGTVGWIAPDADITVDVTRDRLQGARDVFPDAPALATGGSSIDALAPPAPVSNAL